MNIRVQKARAAASPIIVNEAKARLEGEGNI